MVYCVGLTGNLASGKSTVAQLFAELGVVVINADKIAKDLCVKNSDAYGQIVSHFGSDVLHPDGELNRRKLRDIIFSDQNKRVWLENLLHPLIRKRIQEEVKLATTPYCVVEIPLLISKDQYPYLNTILVVSAPTDLQISRVMERDHCTLEQAQAILAAQPDMNSRLSIADDVLVNNSDLNSLKNAVDVLHRKYLSSVG